MRRLKAKWGELWNGDSLAVLRKLPPNSVQMCVTSPPYFGLRDYGTGDWEGGKGKCDHLAPLGGGKVKGVLLNGPSNRDGYSEDGQFKSVCKKCGAKRIDKQIGLEKSPEEFIQNLVAIFREVRRVLHPTGILILNLGDSYGSGGSGNNGSDLTSTSHSRNKGSNQRSKIPAIKGMSKQLLGIPWRTALALQSDGWILRSDIPWVKRSPMPESCTDRPAKSLEYVFLLAKNEKYYWDNVAIRKKSKGQTQTTVTKKSGSYAQAISNGEEPSRVLGSVMKTGEFRNFRNNDLWFSSLSEPWGLCGAGEELIGIDASMEPSSELHYASYPTQLIKPFILAGTSQRGCCSKCFSPYTRKTKKETIIRDRPNSFTKRTGEEGTGNVVPNDMAGVEIKTIGWFPSCVCGLEKSIPQIILDPFAGTSTTGVVSVRLNRKYIGIELAGESAKVNYFEISRKRVSEAYATKGLGLV